LEALQKFFSALPPDTGMAFVVVQHLDPKQVSHLPELLGAASRLHVHLATEGMTVEPNVVYVIPPTKTITLQPSRSGLKTTDTPQANRPMTNPAAHCIHP